jgi:hypothetical protein
MSPLLNPSFVSSDEDYKYACDNADAKRFIETLWESYKGFADKDFSKKISLSFHAHFWEMFLACTLKDLGNNLLTKKKAEGPDIGIKWSDSCIWVEAIAASPGQGADRIPIRTIDDEMWFRAPEEQIVLRYATTLKEKYEKYLLYTEKGTIAKTEPYIIAICYSSFIANWITYYVGELGEI